MLCSPCQNCPHRKVMCHSKCAEYLEFHDALVEAKSKISAAQDAIDLLIETTLKRRKKARVKK